jgi:hypothetical protein
MLDGFMNTPEPMILPIIMEVADQKPIFLERDDAAGIINEEDKKELPETAGLILMLRKKVIRMLFGIIGKQEGKFISPVGLYLRF